jgi:signal transduction histidine kinase
MPRRNKKGGTMRLHEFILTNRERILEEWEAFARTCEPASRHMDREELRDHAGTMLTLIARDLQTSQKELARVPASQRGDPSNAESRSAASEEHGSQRAEAGFTVEQTVAEFRALRTTVLHLWTLKVGTLDPSDIRDLKRFNEVLDQFVAESVAEYFDRVEKAKEMFVAILGHDLRTPLAGIQTAAGFMVEAGALDEPYHGLSTRIHRMAGRAIQLFCDLLDLTRSRLVGGIPIERAAVDLSRVVQEVVDEVVAGHPERTVQVSSGPGPTGQWDGARIRQALANLVSNAVDHGAGGSTVKIDVVERGEDVEIRLHNHGDPIPSDKLEQIFDPWESMGTRGGDPDSDRTGSLGLGLYIADQIIRAHGGRIEVASSAAEGTTFTVSLPREA